MFRTARRIAALALVAALVPAASASAVGGGMGAGKVVMQDVHLAATSSFDIRFDSIAATAAWSDGRTTSHTYELEGVVLDDQGVEAAERLVKQGSGTLVLAGDGAASGDKWIEIQSWQLGANGDGTLDIVIASPTDPTEIGLLLPAVQTVREAA